MTSEMSLKRKNITEINSGHDKCKKCNVEKRLKRVPGDLDDKVSKLNTSSNPFRQFCLGYYTEKAEEASQSIPPKSK